MGNELKPINSQEKTWGMFIHLAALIGLLLPLGLVLGPLIVWMLKKNDSAFLYQQGQKAVNFQLTILIIAFVIGLLSVVIRPLLAISFVAGLAGLIFAVVAGINVKQGKVAKYPFSIKLIR